MFIRLAILHQREGLYFIPVKFFFCRFLGLFCDKGFFYLYFSSIWFEKWDRGKELPIGKENYTYKIYSFYIYSVIVIEEIRNKTKNYCFNNYLEILKTFHTFL